MTNADDAYVGAMTAAYDASAASWFSGASVFYGQLAARVVDLLPDDVVGPVLDLCAGAGAASAPLKARRWSVVGLDRSAAMLQVARVSRPPAVCADAFAMPFPPRTFGAVVVACGLNHATDPLAFLQEALRVTRRGGSVLASTFASGWSYDGKTAVDDALAGFGYRSPAWHEQLKHEVEPATADRSALLALGGLAGMVGSHVERLDVALDLSPQDIVSWRFGMASHAPFVAGLSVEEARLAVRAAVEAVSARWEPMVVPLLVLRGLA